MNTRKPTRRSIQLLDFISRTTASDLRTQADIHAWSIREPTEFWHHFLIWSGLRYSGSAQTICDTTCVETARFFPDLTMNYADSLLAPDFPDEYTALISIGHENTVRTWTRAELRAAAERMAGSLRALGIGAGDRVGAITHNSGEAAVMALATAALGGVYVSTSIDMGATALSERLSRVAVKALIVDGGMARTGSVTEILGDLLPGMPSVQMVIILGTSSSIECTSVPAYSFDVLASGAPLKQSEWPRLPFNHPLFILFTSGTTGPPKCIVHGAGGTLIEHVKEHRLHCDFRAGEILFFQTSCGWMMWNWQLSALATGATIVLADSSADPFDAWRIAAEQKATMFGTSPTHLRLSEAAGISPALKDDLSTLRVLLSTGSPLFAEQYEWAWDTFGSQLRVQSISGGTDIIGCFLLGSPIAPIRAGEIQCLSLGMDVRALGATHDNPIGELVCANPFPSRPLGLLDDADGARFHETYFSQNPGFWTHGDAIEVTAEGSVRVHGRRDGVLNLRGIRIGPAEIYRVLFRFFSEVASAMAIDQREAIAFPEGRLVLLIVLREGAVLDEALDRRIRNVLAAELSTAHVPKLIVAVAALPMTHNGKQSETAVTDLLNGRPVRNIAALCNPESITDLSEAFERMATVSSVDQGNRSCNATDIGLEKHLASLWADILHVPTVGPDDNFFQLGGDSLMAVELFAALHKQVGLDVPFSIIFRAPTFASLLAELRRPGVSGPAARTVFYHEGGAGRAVFWIHGLLGSASFLFQVADKMASDRPIIAIEIGAYAPFPSIREVASNYIALIRTEQPQGPYTLGGFSMGALIAYEVGCQLAATGEVVDIVFLLDPLIHWRQFGFSNMARHLARIPYASWKQSAGRRLARLSERVQRKHSLKTPKVDPIGTTVTSRMAMLSARSRYYPPPYDGKLLLVVPEQPSPMSCPAFWRDLAPNAFECVTMPGDHEAMTRNTVWLARSIERFSQR